MSITTANKQNLKYNLRAVKNVTSSVAELHKLDPEVGLNWEQREFLISATDKAQHLSRELLVSAVETNLRNSENQEKLQLIADAHSGLEDFVIALLVGDPNNDAEKQEQAFAIRQELRNNNFAQLFLRAEALIEKGLVQPIQQTPSDIGKEAGGLLLNVYYQRLECPTISASTPPSYLFTDRRPNYANNQDPPIAECFYIGVAGILSRATKKHLDVIKSRREDDPAFEFPVARVFAAAMNKLRESERTGGITSIDPQLATAVAGRTK